MKLACIYINALHFRDTVSFYEQLLQQKGKEVTAQRWVEFSCGHTLAVLHAEYDAQCVQKEHGFNPNPCSKHTMQIYPVLPLWQNFPLNIV